MDFRGKEMWTRWGTSSKRALSVHSTCRGQSFAKGRERSCNASLCSHDLERGCSDTSRPREGAMRSAFFWQTSTFERKLSEDVWLTWACLFLEEHQLQTLLSAGPFPGPRRVRENSCSFSAQTKLYLGERMLLPSSHLESFSFSSRQK